MSLSSLQILKSEIKTLANEPITVHGVEYFKKLGRRGLISVIQRVALLLESGEHTGVYNVLYDLLHNLQKFKNVDVDDKIAGILAETWKYLNNLERKNIIQKLDKAIDKTIKTKLLADVEHFLLKMKKDSEIIIKSATDDYVSFVSGYNQLINKGPTNETLINKLYDIIPVDIKKSVDNKLDKIIEIDNYAHVIHGKNCGEEVREILDNIAVKAKSAGEENREDRLLVLFNPNAAEQLKSMSKLKVLYKAKILEQRLKYRAEKHGLESLENDELCILWGFCAGEIN